MEDPWEVVPCLDPLVLDHSGDNENDGVVYGGVVHEVHCSGEFSIFVTRSMIEVWGGGCCDLGGPWIWRGLACLSP